jgi:hypothetical protein
MLFVVILATLAIGTSSLLAAKYQNSRRRADPFTVAFRRREFRAFDARLEAIAREENLRLEVEVVRYLAGCPGDVVLVSNAPQGVALELSDGRRLSLAGISLSTVELLNEWARLSPLRPHSAHRDSLSWQLLLRGAAGTEIKIYARHLALAG